MKRVTEAELKAPRRLKACPTRLCSCNTRQRPGLAKNLCSCIAFLLVAGVVFAQEATFKVDVRLVRLIATVKDTGGKPVGGMEKSEFTVLDNGVAAEHQLV